MNVIAFPGHADAMAFPGHAGRGWPLARRRSLARTLSVVRSTGGTHEAGWRHGC
jgi:hypothetical protein